MHVFKHPIACSLTALMVAAVLGTGCDKGGEPAGPAETAAAGRVETPPMPETVQPTNPDDVLVTVNGQELTRAEAEQEAAMRLNAVRQQVPPERMPEVRQQMYRNVIEQFVVRELLLDEAQRRSITVTEEDRSNAYARIAASLPDGMTVEQAMAESPMGRERMEAEVEQGLTISKLLAMEISNAVSVTAEDVAAFREENKDSLMVPEQVGARHILIGFEEGDDETAKAEKKKAAEDIRKQLEEGADFEEMAKEHSTGPSGPRGGDLGMFGRGQMVPEFEAAAFSQAIGEIGALVETKFGYHIIEVTAREEAGTISDERIEEMLKRQGQRDTTGQLIEELKSAAEITYAEELQAMGFGSEE